MADRLESTIDAVSLATVLAQPWASVVLSGAAADQHIRSNVAALALSEQVDLDQWNGLVAELSEQAEGYWATRSGLSWN